jgi:Skp family chaperone for outer membrane proteins
MNRSFFLMIPLAIVGLVLAGASQGWGQPSPGLSAGGDHPVATLDMVRIFNECEQIKALNEQIRRRTEEVTREAQMRREVIEGKQEELTAFQRGGADYEDRRRALMKLNVDANVWFKMEEEAIEQDRFHWTRVIYEQAVSAAGEVAKERGYGVVLQRMDFKPFEIEQRVQTLRRMIQERIVVYNVPEVDITDIVVRRLDSAYQASGGKKQLGPSPQSKP